MPWTQTYDPFGPWLSPIVAAIPIVLLLALLATGRASASAAALVGLVSSLLIAIFLFNPPETTRPGGAGLLAWAGTVLASAGYGAAFGLFPIVWIVLAAIFLHNL